MVGTKEVSESRGSFDGPPVDPGYLARFPQAHEAAGFDRGLIGYHATGPDGIAVAAHVLNATTRLKVLIAHRPGFVAPTLVARKLATLDQLTGAAGWPSTTSPAAMSWTRSATATSPTMTAATPARPGSWACCAASSPPPRRTWAARPRRRAAGAQSPRTCTWCGASRSPRSPSGSRGSARKRPGTGGRSGSACRSGRSWARPRTRRGSAPSRSGRPPRSGWRARGAGRPAGTRRKARRRRGPGHAGSGRPGSGDPGARPPPVRFPRILLGRLGAAPAAGGRAGGVRRPALVRGDPADPAGREL